MLASGLVLSILAMLGLSGCVYFNTYYNADKAFNQALRLKKARLEANPLDSLLVSPEEKVKLDRCIEKSSKVLELYPDKKEYLPKSIFLIAESFLLLGEYPKAIQKYDELERFFAQASEMPTARFHRAKAYFYNGQLNFAKTELIKVAENSNSEFQIEALTLLAQLEMKNDSAEVALAVYNKLLQGDFKDDLARGRIHYAAAQLAFGISNWEQARVHAKASEIANLPTPIHYRADLLATDCLFKMGKIAEQITELKTLLKNRLYTAFVPEINIRLALAFLAQGQKNEAIALFLEVPRLAPQSQYSAEAFFRLGDYQLNDLKDEKKAKQYFDSAAAAGDRFEFGHLAAERSQALSRLAQLRSEVPSSGKLHSQDFMIAELFVFNLNNIDSALMRLDKIVQDTLKDSNFTERAAYARAFLKDEFKRDKSGADSLYRYVLQKFPKTEYAKQAERNLGLEATVKTDEDKAHTLFLEAEKKYFNGDDLTSSVIKSYHEVVNDFPKTKEAAKAQFVIAMLFDVMPRTAINHKALDSAKTAYLSIRDNFPSSPFFDLADAKIKAAGITGKAGILITPGAAKTDSIISRPTPTEINSDNGPTPSDSANESVPVENKYIEDHPKEEVEPDYNKVDQY